MFDPFDQSVGLKLPIPSKFTADVIVSSHDDSSRRNTDGVGGNPFLITSPGEYEVKNTFVYGHPIPAEKGSGSMFRMEAEDLMIAHMGSLSKPLENSELDFFEETDILIVPVGGGNVLSYEGAVQLISELEPRVVIPCFYGLKGLKAKLDPVEKFLKEFGVKNPETIDRYKVTRKELPQDEVKVILLTPQI